MNEGKENAKTCGHLMYDKNRCGRKVVDGSACIFHSQDIESKKNNFNKIFWQEFMTQQKYKEIIDFTGFIFPVSIYFWEKVKKIEKKIIFRGARFLGKETIFNFVKFMQGVDFGCTEFQGETTYFMNTEFHGDYVYFDGATFSAEFTVFEESKFLSEELSFSHAQFSSGTYTSFKKAHLSSSNKYFQGTKFSGKFTSFVEAEFSGGMTDLTGAQFLAEETDFKKVKFSDKEINIFNSHYQNISGLFDSLRNKKIKRILRGKYKIKDFRFYLGEKSAEKYPMIKRMVNDAWYLADFKGQHHLIYLLWYVTSKCGQSIMRWSMWSLGFTLIFAFIYHGIYLANHGNFSFNPYIQERTIWTFIYYSVVTFTTLGFGDIIPTATWVQRWVMAEVILGYIMLGGLISIFANKLARRS